MRMLDRMVEDWNKAGLPVEQRLYEALCMIERLHEERLDLQRRIHNQRKANRDNWQIVEQRRKWLGSDTARRHAMFYLAQFRAVRDKLNALLAQQPSL